MDKTNKVIIAPEYKKKRCINIRDVLYSLRNCYPSIRNYNFKIWADVPYTTIQGWYDNNSASKDKIMLMIESFKADQINDPVRYPKYHIIGEL